MFKTEDSNWYRLDITEGQKPVPREMQATEMINPTTMMMYGGRGFSNRSNRSSSCFSSSDIEV